MGASVRAVGISPAGLSAAHPARMMAAMMTKFKECRFIKTSSSKFESGAAELLSGGR
jgi:hypothetical protein